MTFRRSAIHPNKPNHLLAAPLAFAIILIVGVANGQQLESTAIPDIGPIGEIEMLSDQMQFTEGPTSNEAGTLFFTDIPANRIYQIDEQGERSVFMEPSAHANGLMLVGDNQLLACQMDGQLVSIDITTKQTTVLAATFQGNRFNAPNDLVIDSSGGIYFTDPHFRAPSPLPQEVVAVYYRAADGTVTRLIDDLAAPNGVILSPDESTLYVVPSMQKQIMAYPVQSSGELGEGTVLCELQQADGSPDANRGGDGLTVDTAGNLYITSGIGIQVFDAAGLQLGVIAFPEQPANVTFGGPNRTHLIVTARTSVYAVEMQTTGHVFPGQ